MRSIVDPTPITYGQFVAGYDYSQEAVACQFLPPLAPGQFDARNYPLVYMVRVPNPQAPNPQAPNAFSFLRLNYNGLEYMNPHEAKYLYDANHPVWLVRRQPPARRTRPPTGGGTPPKPTPYLGTHRPIPPYPHQQLRKGRDEE